MAEYKYRTKNGEEVFVPGIGQTENGILTSRVKIENPALELIGSEDSENHLTGTAPQGAQSDPHEDEDKTKDDEGATI